ncbi:MAG: sigma 54-interacting transcriptional regulator [Planctomycetaceae bacterium]|nr:sigma 54-interacting transcriptional regulator [Planctomycetales bacterium]MCB9920578.1 sigma 54-interacting transcriptional regulator [Planctomycetaceae bacterium]
MSPPALDEAIPVEHNGDEAFLVARDGGVWRDIFRLPANLVTTIGREPSNRIILREEKCSRRQCELSYDDRYWMIRDLNSRNGTRVNGERIVERVPIHEGDVIRIGGLELMFTTDISRPLDQPAGGTGTDADRPRSGDTDEDAEPQIIERKSSSRYLTESHLGSDSRDASVREAIAGLYQLVVRMVSATSLRELSETVLERLLETVSADIGAVLLFPADTTNHTDPNELRVMSYRAPEDAPYHKVSTTLSRLALTEREAILAIDLGSASTQSEFQTLSDMHAQSVICAPIRCGQQIRGLLHLYSLDTTNSLDAEKLEYTLAVADQFGMTLPNLSEKDQLTGELERACDENRSLRRLLEIESDLLGNSRAMQSLRDTIARVASSDATALIRGESGVGKELVARAIHFNSNRRDKPFVCLNCAALTESLLESELFGHERGSFTGATDKKIGKFEQADQGTLFLDEVGEMPLSIQAKFLRVLEGHPFERVGGNANIKVDVRVVAATNRELEAAVDEGGFRKDLFFRLQILELLVPPLREHLSDVPTLANHFLERCCQRIGHRKIALSEGAIRKLTRHEWPGNVRELRNVIERAVVLADGVEILEADIRLMSTAAPRAWLGEDPMLRYEPVAIEVIESDHIRRTLKWTNWNKREASRILGINRSTLDRKLERYGIQQPTSE